MKYLPETIASLAGSKLHLCELCLKLSIYSSEVHKDFCKLKKKKNSSDDLFLAYQTCFLF